jgi:DNA polymerase III subunit tau, C-terminal domain
VRIREGREERLMTELALIKLTRPETASDSESLIARMDRLERRMGKPAEVPKLAEASTPAGPSKTVPAPADEHAPSATTAKEETSAKEELAEAAAPLVSDHEPAEEPKALAIDITFEQLQKIWPGLFGGLRDVLGARRWAFFREAVPAAVEGNIIVLEVAHDFHLSALEQDDVVSKIVATKASDLFGSQVRVKFRSKTGQPAGVDSEAKIDMSQLEERPAAETDPTALLAAELGAEVVDE